MDREAWRAAIHGVTKSQTRLSDWTELKHPPNRVLFTHDQIRSPSHTHTSSLLSCIKPQLFSEHAAHFLSSDFNFIVHLGRPFHFLLFHYANEISFKGHSSWKGFLFRMNSPAFLWYFRVDLFFFFLWHLTFQLSLLSFTHFKRSSQNVWAPK